MPTRLIYPTNFLATMAWRQSALASLTLAMCLALGCDPSGDGGGGETDSVASASSTGTDSMSDDRVSAGEPDPSGVSGMDPDDDEDPRADDDGSVDTDSGTDSGSDDDDVDDDADSSADSDDSVDTTDGEYAEVDLATLREMSLGPVNPPLVLRDVYVTYVRTIGYFLQETRDGPAIMVHTSGNNRHEDIALGDRISLVVRNLGEFQMQRQIDANFAGSDADLVERIPAAIDPVAELATVLSSGPGIPVSMDMESKLVLVEDATLVAPTGGNWLINYGTGPGQTATYHMYQAAGFCAGAEMDVVGYIERSQGTLRIRSFEPTDLLQWDDSGCGTTDASNWDFESWVVSDPPQGFTKSHATGFAIEQETTRVHQGASSARVTTTVGQNRDLDADYRPAAIAGNTYGCQVALWDDDSDVRVRVAVSFFDASGARIGNPSYSGYSDDLAAWQMFSHTDEAPAQTASFQCRIRFAGQPNTSSTGGTVYLDTLTAISS